jgi:hypothetical protein
MTAYLTLWLAFVAATGAVAWFGSKRQAIAFSLVAAATGIMPAVTLGHPAHNLPNGEHVVLGLKIDEPRAIYVLLDGAPPRYYQLPYSDETAKAMQDAAYAAEAGEGQVVMNNSGDGQPGFSERLQAEPPRKTPESVVIP